MPACDAGRPSTWSRGFAPPLPSFASFSALKPGSVRSVRKSEPLCVLSELCVECRVLTAPCRRRSADRRARRKICPFEIAGDAISRSPTSLRAMTSGSRPGSQHDGLARLADEVDLAVGRDRRRREDARRRAPARRFAPVLASTTVIAADVVGHVDQPAVVDQRRDVGRAGVAPARRRATSVMSPRPPGRIAMYGPLR